MKLRWPWNIPNYFKSVPVLPLTPMNCPVLRTKPCVVDTWNKERTVKVCRHCGLAPTTDL